MCTLVIALLVLFDSLRWTKLTVYQRLAFCYWALTRAILYSIASCRTPGPQSTSALPPGRLELQQSDFSKPSGLVQKLDIITYLKAVDESQATQHIRSIFRLSHFGRVLLCSADAHCHSWAMAPIILRIYSWQGQDLAVIDLHVHPATLFAR